MMHLNDDAMPPEPPSYLQNVQDAILFRSTMEETARTKLCAICSCLCTTVTEIDACEIQNLSMLLASGEKNRSQGFPRAALTTAVVLNTKYCLQPKACKNNIMSCCENCIEELSAGRIPIASLVRCDTGPTPDWLQNLTWMEQQLVNPLRTHQHVVTCIGKGNTFGPKHKALIGHSYCKRNPSLQDFVELLPLDLDRIPDFMSIILCSWTRGETESLEHLLRTSDFLKVRGKLCIQVAHHLNQVSKDQKIQVHFLFPSNKHSTIQK